MRSFRRAAARFRDAGSIPILAALLLIAAGVPLAQAGERSRPSSSSDMGRTAQPRGGGGGGSSAPPSYSPPPSSSGGSGSRTAVPRSGGGGGDHSGGTRQRPHNPGGSGDWHGHHGGGWYGGYYGHSYYPYYYPYWSWGWGWGWWGWPYYGYYGYYGHPYGGYYGAGYYNGDGYGYGGGAGALDTDVSPGKTEIWIDGRYTGTADNYDGFPQYLWLDQGTYDVVLFREGFKTIARQITIRPGQVINLGDRMQPGESVRPESLATTTHERRDERIRSEEERRDEIARQEQGDGMDDWRERARRRMEERDRYEGQYEEQYEAESRDDGAGRLRLDIDPSDASVYLDGHFVGTGTDLQRSRNGIRLDPGQHRIAVVRPGRKAVEQEFTVAAGEDVELEFDLESLE